MSERASTTRNTAPAQRTEEQRERQREYQREYRKRNPDRVRRWRETACLNAAARIAAARAETAGRSDNAKTNR